MGAHLFGVETELAVAADRVNGVPLPVEETMRMIFETARGCYRHLPDERGGMFLENGARFYRDTGGSADHLEYATPETVNPWDTVRHILAGEEWMLRVAEEARRTRPELGGVRVMKHNANYGKQRGAAWGTHESYLHQCEGERLKLDVLPFLVSRTILTGAGGFDPHSPGVKFLISPRVAHLAREISGDTTGDRGIYNTKQESLCADSSDWRRLHVICGESNCSETSMWLKTATTAMVVAMAGAGLAPGEGVGLLKPLESMRRFAGDPALKKVAKRLGGALVSALQMQRHYLHMAEESLGSDFMPDWGEAACGLWREMLDLMEEGGAEAVSTRLDWAIKYAIFGRHLARRGFGWEEAERYTKLAGRLQRAQERHEFGASGLQGVYLECNHVENPCPEAEEILGQSNRERIIDFLGLRNELFEIDLRFMTIGSEGLFRQLEERGALQHRVPGVDNIAHAMETAPQGSRAVLRGAAVKQLTAQTESSPGALCAWTGVRTGEAVLDLRDPFAKEAVLRGMGSNREELADVAPGLFGIFRRPR